MRVNSASISFFTNRWLVGSGIAIVMILCISQYAVARVPKAEHPIERSRELRAKQVNLIIRDIGHRLLLQAGDSTSRVLPVVETKEGRFLLEFETEFDFKHDSLMALSQSLLPKTQFPSGYTVTVHDCLKVNIVWGFYLSNTSPDILPCRGRSEPSGCYIIEFDFPDFYKDAEEKEADIDLPAEEVKQVKVEAQVNNAKIEEDKPQKVEPLVTKSNIEEPKATTDSNDQLTKELKSFKVASQESNSKREVLKVSTFDYPLVNLFIGGTLVLVSVTFLIGRFGKTLLQSREQNQNLPTIKEPSPELTALGNFSFDVKGQRLLLRDEVISLTDKECNILKLLNESFGELISRETLMQKVWLDEGVITGRSLDMFVSKLRKKLSGDPALRITNVHGKGYKIELV
jgi:hypothetical protein